MTYIIIDKEIFIIDKWYNEYACRLINKSTKDIVNVFYPFNYLIQNEKNNINFRSSFINN